MAHDNPFEALVKRDRLILVGALFVLVALATTYTLQGGGMNMSMDTMTPVVWSPGYAILVFVMWWVMMVAMMTPSAAPLVLLYAALRRSKDPDTGTLVISGLFLSGYLVAWAGFSLIATILQWLFELNGYLSSNTAMLTSQWLGGLILISAGLYQLTPIKQACLDHCRSPMQFLSERQTGRSNPFRMGLDHGAYCLGCCWFLMALLFFGGIMNIYWIAGLALLVVGEKLLPHGRWQSYVSGGVLGLWGTGLLAQSAGLL